ncbi:histidine kinase, partial [Mesorhizobium sp. M4B.F.Ca.ET.049.02.1.2]|uniref:histidine kinase n=1 Tax=Mesorhizobium sp. M4B.F.Ca.ET.049.02.1.2 TaxID=2496752 RepID=UPI001FDFF7D7
MQEEQCRRLSRELHDDLGQMLASVALELHGIRAGSPEQGERLTRAANSRRRRVPWRSTDRRAWRPADLDHL